MLVLPFAIPLFIILFSIYIPKIIINAIKYWMENKNDKK